MQQSWRSLCSYNISAHSCIPHLNRIVEEARGKSHSIRGERNSCEITVPFEELLDTFASQIQTVPPREGSDLHRIVRD